MQRGRGDSERWEGAECRGRARGRGVRGAGGG